MEKIQITYQEIKMATRPNIYRNKKNIQENQNIKIVNGRFIKE
jgi:hypothetical protein